MLMTGSAAFQPQTATSTPGDDCSQRTERIADDMQPRAVHVQIILTVAVQQSQRKSDLSTGLRQRRSSSAHCESPVVQLDADKLRKNKE